MDVARRSTDQLPGPGQGLRGQAETLLQAEATSREAMPETTRVLHELRVHQIELELQNEELRQEQLELDASRAHYLDLYDTAPVGYCTISQEELILQANLTAATLLGTNRQALLQQPITRFICNDDQDTYYLLGKQLSQAGAAQTCELSMRKEDGTQFVAQLTASLAHDEEGAPLQYVVLTDISQRKQGEAAARRLSRLCTALNQCGKAMIGCRNQTELFSQICEVAVTFGGVAMAWVGLVDPVRQQVTPVASFGRAKEYLTGIEISVDAASPLGQGPTGVAIRENRPVWCQDFMADPRTAGWHERGAQAGWAASAALPLHCSGVTLGALTLYADEVNAFDEDIREVLLEMVANISFALEGFARETARQVAEEALRESQQELSTILDNLPAYVYLKDRQGRYLFANRLTCELFGMTAAEVVGQPDEHFFDAATAAQIRSNNRRVFQDGEIVTAEDTNFHLKDGRTSTYLSVRLPLRNQAGKIYALCGISTDITELKSAEKEKEMLQSQNRQLQKADSLGRMAGAIAHHFNNQLQVVMFSLELAQCEALGQANPDASLSDAMEAARKAAEVSSLMLTYLGQFAGQQETLDLSLACGLGLPLLRAGAPPWVRVESDLPLPGPTISANRSKIQQLLTNLINNAWEAGGANPATIRLSVQRVAAMDIPAVHRFPVDWQPQKPAYACLEVSDTGVGIPAEHIERLFDPFFSSKSVGRGLGLPVVLGIARAHGGAVLVESQPGHGSVVRVLFPLAEAEVPQPPVPLVPIPPKTVLVVDDEPMVLSTITATLQRNGFKVLAARNGVMAVELFRRHGDEIGCVLCDVSMPHMDGWQTLSALRHLAPAIPVILSSGYSEAQVMDGEHPEVPLAFLSKPYQSEQLILLLRQVLSQSVGAGK